VLNKIWVILIFILVKKNILFGVYSLNDETHTHLLILNLPYSVPKGPKSGRASLKTRKGRASLKTREGRASLKTRKGRASSKTREKLVQGNNCPLAQSAVSKKS
jgi:hypothetical protein